MEKRAINRYRLPVPENLLERIDRTSSPAHAGNLRNAIDFIVPENTPVLAAANGIVTYVKDDSSVGGTNPIYGRKSFRNEKQRRIYSSNKTLIS